MKHNKVRRLVSISMLSSIAFILMMLSFPILGAFPYLKIDFSDIPALLAVILYGPGAGIAVEAIKNVLNYFIAGSARAFRLIRRLTSLPEHCLSCRQLYC